MLLCIDEVQTGNGRSGQLYAYMVHGLNRTSSPQPRGWAAACPSARRSWAKRSKDTLTYGDHGSTFGGNPVACAGAVSILSRLDEDFLQGVRERAGIHPRRTGGREGRQGRGRPRPQMLGIETEKPAGEISPPVLRARAGLDGEEQGAAFAAAQHRLGRPQNRGRRAERGDRGVKRRYLVLSSGAVFEGYALGAEGEGLGELVFTTNMCGYPETLTDPSYAGADHHADLPPHRQLRHHPRGL